MRSECIERSDLLNRIWDCRNEIYEKKISLLKKENKELNEVIEKDIEEMKKMNQETVYYKINRHFKKYI